MRKKIILINALTTFFSLIILLITSGFLIYIRNLNNYENAAKNYLSLTCSIFNGTNVYQTYEAVKDTESNIRLTIIDLDGNVVFDSEKALWFEGLPRLKSSLSMQGKSSWIKLCTCNISIAQAIGSASSMLPPKSLQVSRHITGLSLLPPASTLYLIDTNISSGYCTGMYSFNFFSIKSI